MEGLHDSAPPPLPSPPPASLGSRVSEEAAVEALAAAEGRPLDDLAQRLRLGLQAALGQLAESTRLLRERDVRHEELLASAAAELQAAAHLLGAQPNTAGRDEALRRLRRVAEDLERMARTPLPAYRAPPRTAQGARARLLVADDEPDARELLSEVLGGDFEIVTAADGQEAVDLARAQRPDAILLDLNMPRLDGFGVLEHLRADPSTIEIPVILVTARSDDAGKVRALGQGAVDYLQKPFSELELRARVERTLRLMRSQTALRELAQTDALTGLANLRAFRARLDEEVKRARRYRMPITCVMADLDQLKPINDELGHAAGDRAIAAVAAVIREELRETDFGARYGGDEFVVLLPHTAAEEGRVFAERICARLRETEVTIGDRRLALRSSFGVACRLPQAADEPPEALVHAADAALYQAKRAGRGRVVVAGGPAVKP
jgi:two-component system, cell cycle response regulator